MIYRVRDIYPKKCFFVVLYCVCYVCNLLWIIFLGRAAKTNLKKLKRHRRSIRASLFTKTFGRVQDILRETNLITVFEFFILEVFREILNQLRSNGTTKFSNSLLKRNSKKREVRKGLLPVPYSRPKNKSKLVELEIIEVTNEVNSC